MGSLGGQQGSVKRLQAAKPGSVRAWRQSGRCQLAIPAPPGEICNAVKRQPGGCTTIAREGLISRDELLALAAIESEFRDRAGQVPRDVLASRQAVVGVMIQSVGLDEAES